MLTVDEVIWGYRYILGRDPESASVLEQATRSTMDRRKFRQVLLRSQEFVRGGMLPNPPQRWVMAEILGRKRLIWLDLGDDFVSRSCLLDNYEPFESELKLRRSEKYTAIQSLTY